MAVPALGHVIKWNEFPGKRAKNGQNTCPIQVAFGVATL